MLRHEQCDVTGRVKAKMAECSYARCVQERRAIKKELQRWTKNMVFVVGECIQCCRHTSAVVVAISRQAGAETAACCDLLPKNP